ncbi:FAD-binding oxidoreductase [Candidatus Chloroploca sp. Khr17]|uniref:FAD-binding oxidoreductase n=1 Tax=Candidatus Chloroploca sp. Khr17 TaxID=2496869 RepID=UPI00101D686F|nr:FAD-linked oxidase C-terminal domain-containing protein [Candidatus Chloroploca sp. Khr17]
MDHTRLIAELKQIVGVTGVVADPDALMTYDADGCVMDTHAPHVVVLPTSTEQVSAIVRLAAQHDVPVVPRGAGTGLSGGATPMHGGIIIGTSRMSQILELDIPNGRVLVQPGVINWELTQYLTLSGYHFAPDPSSQKACTIGGNIANNSGGPHCLKYGVTTNHVLGVEMVLADGSVIWTGDGTPDCAGYDLTGVINGSEGTFGIVTATWLRLTRLPEAIRVVLALYPAIAGATSTVSQVIARGLLPAALEIMDRLAIKAVNAMYRLGMPDEAGALLIVEVDGVTDGLDELMNDIVAICWSNGALDVRPARTPAEQVRVWSARKNAFGAMGRLAPTYHLVDTVVPRTRLPKMMDEVAQIAQEFDLPVANVFHAGDGNLHPIILFDRRDPDQNERALHAVNRMMLVSIEQGGVISGEHGIGVEKQEFMPYLFNQDDLAAMAALHQGFDPEGRFNPGKIFPKAQSARALAEQRHTMAFADHDVA